VYNVPLGGALFTAEVLYGSFALPVVFPALATSLVATVVAWIYLPSGATYADIPNYRFSASLMVWSLLAGVVIGLLAVFYVRLIGWVSHHRAKGANIFWAMPLAFLVVGVLDCGTRNSLATARTWPTRRFSAWAVSVCSSPFSL